MSTIWWAILVALALSILLLATFNEAATLIGATIIAVVNLYRVAFMWVSVVDFGRHRKGSVFFALAAVWFLHLSFRSFGRLLVLWFAQGETTGSTVLIALLLFMLIGSTALVLSSDIPRLRPLFAGINVLPAMAQQAAQDRPTRPGTSTSNTPGTGVSSSADINDEKDPTSPDGIFPLRDGIPPGRPPTSPTRHLWSHGPRGRGRPAARRGAHGSIHRPRVLALSKHRARIHAGPLRQDGHSLRSRNSST